MPELHALCLCGHEFGKHSKGTSGPCLHGSFGTVADPTAILACSCKDFAPTSLPAPPKPTQPMCTGCGHGYSHHHDKDGKPWISGCLVDIHDTYTGKSAFCKCKGWKGPPTVVGLEAGIGSFSPNQQVVTDENGKVYTITGVTEPFIWEDNDIEDFIADAITAMEIGAARVWLKETTGVSSLSVNGSDVEELLASYAKKLTNAIEARIENIVAERMAQAKKQYRDRCIPSFKNNSRKFRT